MLLKFHHKRIFLIETKMFHMDFELIQQLLYHLPNRQHDQMKMHQDRIMY